MAAYKYEQRRPNGRRLSIPEATAVYALGGGYQNSSAKPSCNCQWVHPSRLRLEK